MEDTELLVRDLRRAVRDGGGWIVHCRVGSDGVLNLLFEFERWDGAEIYGALVACGLELSAGTHRNLTQLCQCNRFRLQSAGAEIALAHLKVGPPAVQVLRTCRLSLT